MPTTQLCTYHYDPLDRLTSHTTTTYAPIQRFYCKSRLATEIGGAISRSIVQHDDQLLAQTETQSNARQATLLATDQQRSVLQAITSNESQSCTYSPYGYRPAGNGLLSLLGFNGERPDPVTGYYFLGNGYRAFNPVLMRFNSPDKLSPFGKGGINPYAYCSGDPINRSDPNGTVGVFNAFFQSRRLSLPSSFLPAPSAFRRPSLPLGFHTSGPETVFSSIFHQPKGWHEIPTSVEGLHYTQGGRHIINTQVQRLDVQAHSVLTKLNSPPDVPELGLAVELKQRAFLFNHYEDNLARLLLDRSDAETRTYFQRLSIEKATRGEVQGIDMRTARGWEQQFLKHVKTGRISEWESNFLKRLNVSFIRQ
ncbi:RHS repeat-associated core domain-containing protein [Pseudomonas ogarae]